jgi:trigger factor
MQVTEINADGLKHDFKVVIPAGRLEEMVQARLGEVARTINLPGFRPGKVPMKLVRQKYGAAVLSEVMEEAVNDGARTAIDSKGLRPATKPEVSIGEYGEGADLEFTVAVETLPEIQPMDFATVKLAREKAEVPDDDIAETLKRLATSSGLAEAVGRPAQDGDLLLIDFVGTQDGVAFPGGAAEDYELTLGSGTFIPGFEEQLVGKSAGDETKVTVTFPESYGSDLLAGKGAEFEVKIKEVRENRPRELDDELAKAVGLETLDALRDAIREEVGRELDGLSRSRLKRQLLDVLAENHEFPIPPKLLDNEFQSIWTQIEEDRKAGRLDAEDAGKSEDELRGEYMVLAERRVRLGLLLAEVGRVNKIDVSQDDVNRALVNEARRFPGQEHMVFQYYRDHPEAIDQLRAPIYEDKVIDFILELAQVEDRTVTAADLRAAPGTEKATDAG